jgi:hypothetical protein
MSDEIEKTGTNVQHADDLSRDISNCILEWQRRNPGAIVIELSFEFNRDVMAPYGYVKSSIERDKCPHGEGWSDYCLPCNRIHGGG